MRATFLTNPIPCFSRAVAFIFYPEDGWNRFLQIITKFLPDMKIIVIIWAVMPCDLLDMATNISELPAVSNFGVK
jgi:hypothetical protein